MGTRSDLVSLSVGSQLELIYLENMVACENRAIFFVLLRGHCWGFLNGNAVTYISESMYIMFKLRLAT